MNYSFFEQSSISRDYLPDSIYTICESDTEGSCTVCSNNVFSPVVNGTVHDIQRAKVFCPFGKDESMNKSNYDDQDYLTKLINTPLTTWGRVPQLNPKLDSSGDQLKKK